MKQLKVCLLFITLLSLGYAQNIAEMPRINVSGEGVVYAEPEIATISFGINNQSKDLEAATQEANSKISAIRQALEGLGVEAKDIRTAQFSIWPQEDYDRLGKATGQRSYTVNHMLSVTVRDISKVGKVLSQAIAAGANSVQDIQYSFANRKALESEARAAAIADALSKAEELAKLTNISVGAPLIIEETAYPIATNFAMPVSVELVSGSMNMQQGNVPVSGGQLAVKVIVSVVFRIHALE